MAYRRSQAENNKRNWKSKNNRGDVKEVLFGVRPDYRFPDKPLKYKNLQPSLYPNLGKNPAGAIVNKDTRPGVTKSPVTPTIPNKDAGDSRRWLKQTWARKEMERQPLITVEKKIRLGKKKKIKIGAPALKRRGVHFPYPSKKKFFMFRKAA